MVSVSAATYHLRLAAVEMRTESIPVKFANHASRILRHWRDTNRLGSSDFTYGCGDVTDHQGNVVAGISYNGRIRDADGKPALEETI